MLFKIAIYINWGFV